MKNHRFLIANLFLDSNRGSMLLELALLISLLGLFAAGFLLSFQHSPAAAHTAMYKVANDIRYAQNLAMVTGINHGFRTFDASRYEIYSGSPGNPVRDPSTTGPMTIDLVSDFRDTRFQGSYRVEFNSLGKPTLGGGSTIELGSNGAVKSFVVTNNTGMLNMP